MQLFRRPPFGVAENALIQHVAVTSGIAIKGQIIVNTLQHQGRSLVAQYFLKLAIDLSKILKCSMNHLPG